MYKSLLTLSVFIGCFFSKVSADSSSSPPEKKTVCLNMIVKNESKVIKRCLESVKPYIQYWVIVDTGSTDGTQEIIRQYLQEIPGELHERPWVDFAHNRNEALELAKGKGDHLLLMDADEKLVYHNDFKGFPLEKDYSLIPLRASTPNIVGCQRLLLINNHLNWKWKGVLHEFLITPPGANTFQLLKDVDCFTESDGFRAEDPQKYQKDAAILEKALLSEPDNSRYVFYLAQSYVNAADYEKAVKNYEKRATMGGDPEEIFVSLHLSGRLKELLNRPIDEIIQTYSSAYQKRPIRAEPLYYLGGLYLRLDNNLLAYAHFKMAADLPIPDDFSFMERHVYEYAAAFEMARAAALIGKNQESLEVFEKLLTNPHVPKEILEMVEQNIYYLKQKLTKEISFNLEKNLKKLDTPLVSTKLKNIDCIYLLNLDERPERLKHCLDELAPYEIIPARFPAVYGWSLSGQTINELGLRFTKGMEGIGKPVACYPVYGKEKVKTGLLSEDSYGLICFHHLMTPGAIGCTLSHLSALQNAYDAGYETIWILEDDIKVIEDPHVLSSVIEHLDAAVGKENWDVLYTDTDKNSLLMYTAINDFETDLKGINAWAPNLEPNAIQKLAKRTIINDEFIKIGSRWWAHSLIIRRSGMKKILDYKKSTPLFNGYDLEIALTPGLEMFMTRRDIVTFSGAFVSDTGNDHLKKEAPR